MRVDGIPTRLATHARRRSRSIRRIVALSFGAMFALCATPGPRAADTTVTISQGVDADTLNPLATTITPTFNVVGQIYERFTGPAGRELGTGPTSVPSQLPVPTFTVGVIAGTKTINPLFSRMLGGENDGKVRVDSARMDGVADFLSVPHSHPMLMMSPVVVEQALYFLDAGHFRRAP